MIALVPVLFYIAMGPWILPTLGRYHWSAGAYTLLFLVECSVMLTIDRWKPPRPRLLKLTLSAGLIWFTWTVYQNPEIIYAEKGPALQYFKWISACVFVLSIAMFLPLVREKIQRSALLAFRSAAIGAAVLLVVALFLVPIVSPRPFIDVWSSNQAAVDFFLRGLNPYPQTYPDIYHGYYNYQPGFLYFPGILFWLAPFRAIFGDIRYGFVFANILTAIGIFSLARKLRLVETLRWLLTLLWLAFPLTFYVLEQSWIDTLLVCTAVLALWSAESRRWVLAGIFGGLAFAMKQYGFLITGFVLLRIWRAAGWRESMRAALASAVVFAALVLPYAAWDWSSFYRSTIGGHADTSVRFDAFNFTAFLYNKMRILIPGAMRVGLSVLGIAGAGAYMIFKPVSRLSDAPAALVLSYGIAFLFGKWAFTNYHYLLAGCLLLFLVTSSAERTRVEG